MDISQIKKRIQEKWPDDYTQEHTLDATLEDIEKMPTFLRVEFEKFLETNELPKMEIEGWDADRLIQEKRLHPVAAFLMIDWLSREPEEAKQALSRGVR